MNWRRTARYVVAAAGLGTAVAIYVSTRPAPPATKPVVATPVDPAATMQTGRGVDVRSKGEKQVWRLEYEGTKSYNDGRLERTGVHVVLDDGTELWADVADMRGRGNSADTPGQIGLTGHVRLKAPDGASAQADHADYADATGTATMPGPVTFARGGMSGQGIGGIYERGSGNFQILKDAHMTIDSGTTAGAHVQATGASATFTRVTNILELSGGATLSREAERMEAAEASLLLTDDGKEIRTIQLKGNSHIAAIPGKTSDLPDMQAAEIALGFYPGGQALQSATLDRQARMVLTDVRGQRSIEGARVTFQTAPDGKTLTNLQATSQVVVKTPASADAPERTIKANSMAATGDAKNGLTLAQFSGNVDFSEVVAAAAGRPAGHRTGTAQTMTLRINGQFDAVQQAQFQTNATFQDGEVSGNADRGLYYAAEGRLELRPADRASRRPPHVTDGGLTIDASDLITVDLNTHAVVAQKDVKTSSVGGGTRPAKATGMFNTHDTVYGSAAELHSENSTTRYVGTAEAPARLRQGETEVKGRELELNSDTQDLTATGSVTSAFVATDTSPGAAPAKPALDHASADAMKYVSDAGTATYQGAAMLDSAETNTSADTIVLTMAKNNSQSLDRLDAAGKVYVLFADGRQALGDELHYETAIAQYTLRGLQGRAVTLKSKDTDGTCHRGSGTVVIFKRELGSPIWPGNPGGEHLNTIPCTQSIK